MSEAEIIHAAFGYDTALCDRILAAAKQNRDQMKLFVDVARYTSKHMQPQSTSDSSSKKRKLEDDNNNVKQESTAAFALSTGAASVYSAPDTSFAVPQRKKMSIELVVDANKPASGIIGVTHEASGINYAIPFSEIDQAFCLPVPEKAQRQWNFVVFSKKAFDKRTGAQITDAEQLVWTMNETSPTTIKASQGYEPLENDTYVTSCLRSMNTCLATVNKTTIIPSEKEFASAIPQSHRKGEAAYHIKAHRGSKDGYLFLVSTGIIWAFKKPLALFNFDAIESISYTSVLQRTFNLVITTMPDPTTGKQEEVEFSMLDQADFAGIDEYVKRHNLNDASMAAERQAKKLNINGNKGKGGDEGETANGAEGGEEDEETELQKAAREMQDAEDDDESEGEDYDPGSEGESEGEGSDSDDEEDGDQDGEGEEMEEDDEEEEGEEEA